MAAEVLPVHGHRAAGLGRRRDEVEPRAKSLPLAGARDATADAGLHQQRVQGGAATGGAVRARQRVALAPLHVWPNER